MVIFKYDITVYYSADMAAGASRSGSQGAPGELLGGPSGGVTSDKLPSETLGATSQKEESQGYGKIGEYWTDVGGKYRRKG